MPQRDLYHQQVKQALVNDGWTITDDPYRLSFGGERGYIDLGAAVAAVLGSRTIAVEVKSFVGSSTVADLEQAVGQYLVYASWMRRTDPNRELWLAVSEDVALTVFDTAAGQVIVSDYRIRLLVVDVEQERIVGWRP